MTNKNSPRWQRWRRDVSLLIAVVTASAALQFHMSTNRYVAEAGAAVVTARGEVVARLSLTQDNTFTYTYEGETNEIVVESRSVYVNHANCDGGDCVRQGKISHAGQSIVCLPHKLIIELSAAPTPDKDIKDIIDIIVR